MLDQYGAPLPNTDQRQVDIHGKALAPASDPDMPYKPTPMNPELVVERAAMMRDALNKKAFTQRDIDRVRHRVRLNFARTCVLKRDRYVQMRHLWWPNEGDIGTYELRLGNAPSNCDRPKHLRKLKLHIDCTNLASDIHSLLCPGGRLEQLVQQRIDASGDVRISTAMVLQQVIAALADEMWQKGLPI